MKHEIKQREHGTYRNPKCVSKVLILKAKIETLKPEAHMQKNKGYTC